MIARRTTYLSNCPAKAKVVYLRFRRRWFAVYPHDDGTWYEGSKRQFKADAEKDLEAYGEMLVWLRGRGQPRVGVSS